MRDSTRTYAVHGRAIYYYTIEFYSYICTTRPQTVQRRPAWSTCALAPVHKKMINEGNDRMDAFSIASRVHGGTGRIHFNNRTVKSDPKR